MTEVLMLLALAGNGIAVGVFIGTVLGGVPLLLALPAERYVHAHGFLATRYDPFMPVTLAATAALDVVIAVTSSRLASHLLYGLAGAVIAAVMMVSVTKTVPINRWVTSLDPAALPPDFQRIDPRDRWRSWNLVRTVLAVAGLVLNLAAASTLL